MGFNVGRFISNKKMEQGFSLLESVIALAVLGVTAAAVGSGFSYLFKQQMVVSQKIESTRVEQSVGTSMLRSQSCKCMLNPENNTTNNFSLKFDSTKIKLDDPETFGAIRLSTLYGDCDSDEKPSNPLLTAGQEIPGTNPPITVQNIFFNNLQPLDVVKNNFKRQAYRGTFTVQFSQGGSILQSTRIPQTVVVAGPPNERYVESCRLMPGAGGRAYHKVLCEEVFGLSFSWSTNPPCTVGPLSLDYAKSVCGVIGGEVVKGGTHCRLYVSAPPSLDYIGGMGTTCDTPLRGDDAMNINIQRTLRSIAELLTTPEFSEEFQLQARLTEVFSFESSREVINGIYRLVGVDGQDPSETFSFLSGKETLKEDQIAKVMKESQLNRRQSEILIAKVAQTMAGDLR